MQKKLPLGLGGGVPLGFASDDRGTIEIVRNGVARLLSRTATSAREALSLASLLVGLDRLPFGTPGLDVQLYFRWARANNYFGVKLSEDEFLVGANTGGDELEVNCLDTVILWVMQCHREGIEMPEVVDWLSEWEESTCQPDGVRQILIEESSTASLSEIVGFAGQLSDEADWDVLPESEE